jgi:major intracellular serine protease
MKNLCLTMAVFAIMCPLFLFSQIVVNPPINDDVNVDLLELNCANIDNGTIMVSIEAAQCGSFTGPLTIAWFGPTTDTVVFDNLSVETQYNVPITGLPVGIYNFSVLTGNGCTGSCEVKVLQGDNCEVVIETVDVSPPSCYGANNGSISLLVENNEGEVTYKWNDGSTDGPSRTGLAAGSYFVTVTDQGNGCYVEGGFYDLYPIGSGVFPFLINSYPDSSFALPRTGGFQMGSDGGTLPFSARLLNPELGYDSTTENIQTTEFTIGQLAAGQYTVILRDANGCEDTEDVNIGYKRVIPPGELFILEHADNITFEEFYRIDTTIARKAGKKKICRCSNNGIEYLQLWESKEKIELLTSGDASTTKTRPDTSGLKSILIDTTWLSNTGTATTPPCRGSTLNPQSANVAVIDSGSDLLSPHRLDGHQDLNGVYWTNRRTANGGPNTKCPVDDYEGYDFVGKTGQVVDDIGHGTHLAGILKYATPDNVNLKLMNLKVCSPDTSYAYSIFDLVCAIHYAVDSGAQVINLSLGYSENIPSVPLYNALKRAEMEDIPVVVSAGNSTLDLSKDTIMRWPVFFKKPHGNGEFKKLDNLLVVTSINDANSDLDSYANYGSGLVDIATVGDFFSTYTYYEPKDTMYHRVWRAFKGTSQAAAYASSVIGTVKAHNPLIKTSDLFQQINLTRQQVDSLEGKLNWDGTLNAAALYQALGLSITFPQGISAKTKLGWTPEWSIIEEILPGARVQGILKHKGTRTILNNVMLIITARITGGGGVQEVDRIYYCATDIVDWTLPNPLPGNVEQYFATVYVDGVRVEPTMPITPKR